jgi:hypothetical protein
VSEFQIKTWGGRGAAALFVLVSLTSSVAAEVCDKTWGVPENWDIAYGPVYRGLFHSPLATVSLIVVLGIFMWWPRLPKVSFLLAALSLVWIFLIVQGDPDTREFAVREGCISDWMDFLVFVIYVLAAALFTVVGVVAQKRIVIHSPTSRQ